MSQRPSRENPEAGTRAAKKQAMQARLKNMEVERLKMNTFLKESGYVRHPVAEDGDCCYLAILGSLGVLPPGEVANPGSSSLRAVKVLREMAYASVTGTSILDEADLEAFHESIPPHFVRKNSRNKNDVKNMDKRGDIFTKLLEYHIPLGRWKDSLSLQPFWPLYIFPEILLEKRHSATFLSSRIFRRKKAFCCTHGGGKLVDVWKRAGRCELA